jgi:predicted dehydrogenase
VILKAAEAKKHIFCDKALALKSEDTKAIREAVEKNGVKFMLSLESKIIGCYKYATDMVRSGKLGRITAVYFRRAHMAALTNMLPAYWFDTEQTGGGVTLDLGCHGFYMLPQLCGKPKTVSCRMQELYGTGADESSTTIIEFENGCIGTAHTSFVSYKMDNLLEIIGTEGILIISGEPNNANFVVLLQCANVPGYEEKTAVPKSEIPADDPLPIVQFARMVKSDASSVPGYDLDVAATLTRMIECAYESAQTGKVVEF